MNQSVFSSVIEAKLRPEVVRVQGNLYAACFFLMKLIPAHHILIRAREEGSLAPGAAVIESSSGSFALALAMISRLSGFRLTLVSDPVIDERLGRRLRDLGATLDIVSTPAPVGGIQKARLDRLTELMRLRPNAYWPQQYENLRNPESYGPTAESILGQLGRIDVLGGPVGSGGSVGGFAAALRQSNPDLRVIGVDTFGSVLFGQKEGPRLLRGLGNSLMPGVLDHTLFDEVHWLSAAEAFRATRELHSSTALFQGPTSGAAWMVARWYARRNPGSQVLVLCPDEGYRYLDDVYDDSWLRAKGVLLERGTPEPHWVTHPDEAGPPWAAIEWRRRTIQAVTGHEEGASSL